GVGGNYLSLSADGLFVGTGIYKPEPAVLGKLRDAIADDESGRELERIVQSLRRAKYRVDTHESVASAPRGFAADHPRIELLRMKDMFAGKTFAPKPWLSTPRAVARVKEVIR